MTIAEKASLAADSVKSVKKRTSFQLDLVHLSGYAAFLLKNKLNEVVTAQLDLFKELKLPLFKYFDTIREEELVKRGKEGTEKLLIALAENRTSEYIDNAVQFWITNQLPQISRDQVQPEDITTI